MNYRRSWLTSFILLSLSNEVCHGYVMPGKNSLGRRRAVDISPRQPLATAKKLKMTAYVPYERKCPFPLPKDAKEINNMPPFHEQLVIRPFHFIQRKLVQWGGLKSRNPITKLLSLLVYTIDLAWAGLDKEYLFSISTMCTTFLKYSII